MFFSLWMLTAALVDGVYQQSLANLSLSDTSTSSPYELSSSLDSELPVKRLQESLSSIYADDKWNLSMTARQKSQAEQKLKPRVLEENESPKSETAIRKTSLKTSVSAKEQKRNDRSYVKKTRRLYECISDEVQLNSITENNQQCPFVLPLTQDRIVITWSSQFGSNSIKGRLFDYNLNPLGDEFQINSDLYTASTNSHSVLLSNGNYAVLWSNGVNDMLLTIMNDDSIAQSEFKVNTSSSSSVTQENICSSANGGFLVLWTRVISDDQFFIQGRIFDDSGNPVENDFLIFAEIPAAALPKCSSLTDGNFVVTWSAVGGDEDEIGIQAIILSSSGSTIGGIISVNTYTTGNQIQSSVATLTDGNFVIVWASSIQDPDGSSGIYAQLYNSMGGAIGQEFRVNTSTAEHQDDPKVTALYDGGFLVTWTTVNQNGSSNEVYGQRYDALASPVDDEFQINIVTENNQDCSIATTIYNGFIVGWQSGGQDGDRYGVFARAYYNSNTIDNSGVCETCLSYQYTDSGSCLDCLEQCSTCQNGTECETCSESEASLPLCCNVEASISGDSCSVVTVSQYSSGTECIDCDGGCKTCDSLGCLTCIITGMDCCSFPRVLQSDLITCDCSSECSNCDIIGCLTCSSGEDCCPTSRYFASETQTCEDCGSSDDEGCLSCPSGVSTCCPDGRFFNSTTETCEECLSSCKTCENSTECSSCESGSTCCGEGRYSDSNGVCQDCLSDCATCSDGSSCEICTDPDYTAPECCPDSTQDDSNKDGFCECLDGTTAISDCLCPSNEAWYSDETEYSCLGPFNTFPLTIEGLSEIDSSCSEDLEMFVTDFSHLPNTSNNPISFRWFSSSSSLTEYLRQQVSNPLSVPSADLPSGTTTFTAYVSFYGVVFTGVFSVTKSDDVPLTISLSSECLTILSSGESVEVAATVSSQPCPSITYSWTAVSSSRRLQLPDSSSETLLIPSDSLPTDTFTYYTFSASSGSASFSQSLVFYVESPDLVAVIDSVGPEVSSSEDFTLNGSNSSDSSDDTGSLSFFWSCVEIGSEFCPSLSDTANSQITISSSDLLSGMSFTIILTVYKDTRSDSASVRLSVI